MTAVFGFCLRFLVSFLAAKLVLRSLELDRLGFLVVLSLLLTLNLYWFDFTKYSDQLSWGRFRRPSQKDKAAPQSPPPASDPPAPQGP